MSEAIKSGILSFASTLLTKIPNLLQTGADIAGVISLVQNGVSSISAMQQKGRGPTQQEWDQLNGAIDQLESKVYGEQTTGGGAGTGTGVQMRVMVIGGMASSPSKPKPAKPTKPGKPSPRDRGTRGLIIGGMATGATNDPDPGSDPDTVRNSEGGGESDVDRAERLRQEEEDRRQRGSGGPDAKKNVDANKDGVTDVDPESQQDKTNKAREQGGAPGELGGVVGDNRGTEPR